MLPASREAPSPSSKTPCPTDFTLVRRTKHSHVLLRERAPSFTRSHYEVAMIHLAMQEGITVMCMMTLCVRRPPFRELLSKTAIHAFAARLATSFILPLV